MSGRAGRRYKLRKRRRRNKVIVMGVLRDLENFLEALDVLMMLDGEAEVSVVTESGLPILLSKKPRPFPPLNPH